MKTENKPDYGIDGTPGMFGGLFAAEIILFVTGGFLTIFHSPLMKILALVVFLSALMLGFIIASFISYEAGGKLRHRDKLLSMTNWKGDETVLDVGTGRGLLMIGAAKKLGTGKAVGIDIWRQEDMMNNTFNNTMKNAGLEGVLEKIEVKNSDAQKLDFQNASFNVVLSNLCLHNIPTKEGRDAACREIARVLKPNGMIIISDIRYTKEYAGIFEEEGFSAEVLNPGFSSGTPFWYKTVKAVRK